MQEQHEEKSGDVQYIRKANHVLLVDPNRFDTAALDTVAMNEKENEDRKSTRLNSSHSSPSRMPSSA